MIRTLSLRDRLLLYSSVDLTGCWLWTGTRFAVTGYGQITYEGKTHSVHRLAMHVFKEFDLRSEGLVLHRCDVKHCLNPDHLYIGNRFDNANDAKTRGQQMRGSKHHQAKLNEQKVIEIRSLIAAGWKTKILAAQYCVDPSTINLIKRRKIWTHVKGEV